MWRRSSPLARCWRRVSCVMWVAPSICRTTMSIASPSWCPTACISRWTKPSPKSPGCASCKRKTATQGLTLDIDTMPADDSETYRLLSEARTNGVFQLEGRGLRELLRKLQPHVFEDLVALVALYRPGPLGSGMVDDFIERRHGRRVITYDLPALEPILRPTYGVIVFQEQVMQIATTLGGFTLGGADLLRRAMGKKKPEVMAEQREQFVRGAVRSGYPEEPAAKIFDLIAYFAGYGFNRSHSVAYALIAYRTAYLKAYFPREFMAALISTDLANKDKVITYFGYRR